MVLNINFPTCAVGSVRGVPLARRGVYSGYSLVSDIGGVQTWQPTIGTGNAFMNDCTSTLAEVGSDLEAFNNGFATVTPLDPERHATGRKLKDFKFTEKLF